MMVNEFSRQLDFFQDLFEAFTEDDFLDVISLSSDVAEPTGATTAKPALRDGVGDQRDSDNRLLEVPVSAICIDERGSCYGHYSDYGCNHVYPDKLLGKSRSVTPGDTTAKNDTNCQSVVDDQHYTDRSRIPASEISGPNTLFEAAASLKSGQYDNLTALNPNPNNRNKQLIQFPVRLYAMLDRLDRDGYGHIISWQPHGRCFVIHDPNRFQDLLPRYLPGINKLASFQRQVSACKANWVVVKSSSD
jgi:HSF-type DNA-binding